MKVAGEKGKNIDCRFFRIPCISRKGPIKQGLSVLPYFRSPFRPEVMPDRPRFSGKKIPPRIAKIDQTWAKNRVFWIYWKIWSLVFTEFVLWSNFELFSVFLLIFGKTFVPEIWAEMFSANQIAWFFDQPYPQSKSMK